MEKYLTPGEAAEILRISRRTCYNYLRAGYIRAECPVGRWRITEAAVRDFAEGRSGAPGRGGKSLQVVPSSPVHPPSPAKHNPLANRKNKRR